MKAIHVDDLRKRTNGCLDILNNWWIVEKKRRLVPMHPVYFPATSSKEHADEMLQTIFGNNFEKVYIQVAHVPKAIMKERNTCQN